MCQAFLHLLHRQSVQSPLDVGRAVLPSLWVFFFFFQAEDGIRDLVRSRGLGDVYKRQGPEHSSARLERYMQACAEMNMEVCVPSTAAQVFHLSLIHI